MKICIVINHFQITDGVARAAIGIANALVRLGINVTIIPIFKFDKYMMGKLEQKVSVKPVFRFYFRGMAKIIDLIPDKILYKSIIKEQYDIEIGFCMTLPSKIVAASTNSTAKHFIWMHGYDDNLILKECYLAVDQVVSVSKYNAIRLENAIPDLKSIKVCHNLINDIEIVKNGNSKIDIDRGNSLLAVTVGRQSPEKGYARLIECIYKLKKDGLILNLWMIGDGSEHDKLVDLVKKYELNNQILFLGEQKNPHKYTIQADFFICSSFSEGYSTACTEAIVLGVPVFSTRVSGAEEIINESCAGLIVDNDTQSIYEGLCKIIRNKDLVSSWKNTLLNSKRYFYSTNRIEELIDVLGLSDCDLNPRM